MVQNDISGNCDEVWNTFAKNKQLPEGLKFRQGEMKMVLLPEDKIKTSQIRQQGRQSIHLTKTMIL